LYTNKAKGAQIRSRIEFLEEGEKNTRYLMSMDKSRQTIKTLTNLKVNESIYTDNSDIVNEEVKFYSELYKSDNLNEELIND